MIQRLFSPLRHLLSQAAGLALGFLYQTLGQGGFPTCKSEAGGLALSFLSQNSRQGEFPTCNS